MRLIILRHGEAENFAPSDEQRKLTGSGIDKIQGVVRCLLQQQVAIDSCYSSPYLRTRQTADIVVRGLTLQEPLLTEHLTPDVSARDCLRFLISLAWDDSSSILLVSHQPLVTCLMETLLNGQSGPGGSDIPQLRPGGVACLESPAGFGLAPGLFQLLWTQA